MDVAAIMDEVAGRLRTIPDLANRTFAYPPDKITPPSAIVVYPEDIDYRAAGGKARFILPVVVLASRVNVRVARDKVLAFVNSSGPSSVIAVLESGAYATFDDFAVTKEEPDVITIAETDYLGGLFNLDIVATR